MRISIFFVCGYLMILLTQLAQKMIYNQTNYENMSISKKWILISLEPLVSNSENVEGFYKAKKFINNIAFGTSLFVFCDLNTYFQL